MEEKVSIHCLYNLVWETRGNLKHVLRLSDENKKIGDLACEDD